MGLIWTPEAALKPEAISTRAGRRSAAAATVSSCARVGPANSAPQRLRPQRTRAFTKEPSSRSRGQGGLLQHFLAHLEVLLAEMGVGALSPAAHEIVIQRRADQRA